MTAPLAPTPARGPAAATDDPTGIEAVAPATHGNPGFTYKPALDGVRAIAVVAVLIYHGQAGFGEGGFLGVDLFFVLSGYLITSLLLVEKDRHGRIDLTAFWKRRARRLLPALFVMLVGVSIFSAVTASAAQVRQIRGDGLATLFYVANWWYIITGQSYFDQFEAPSPLRHTWSLGIEEQFYVLWPIIIAIMTAYIVKRGHTMIGLAVAALASAALMAAWYLPADPSRVYYGTDTRAQALLVGAVLSFFLHERPSSPGYERTMGWIGIAALALCFAFFAFAHDDHDIMYRGGFLVFAVIAVALIAACVSEGDSPLKKGLRLKPFIAIGAISYGLYLYHWPIYVLLSEDRIPVSAVPLLGLRIGATFAVSIASYYLVEMPIRRHGTKGVSGRVAVGLAIACAVGLIFVAMTAQPESTNGAPRGRGVAPAAVPHGGST